MLARTIWVRASAEYFASLKPARRSLKALELDETLAEGHTDLASVYFWYDWDWSAAEREYRRAIDLNPNHATAHA